MATPAQILIDEIGAFHADPLGFVLYAYDWGHGELAKFQGPHQWQRDVMGAIRAKILAGGATHSVIQEAVASGHGVGKSALVGMLTMWFMSTHEDTRGVITANTDTQLRTKTWPEVSKWHRLAINSDWFVFTATAMFSADPARAKSWRADIIPWSANNTEAFAGLHNAGKRLFVMFDEASSIDDPIWEVEEGALTDANTEIYWLAFGNPTRSTGRFRDCFGRLKHRWGTRHIDSRDVPGTNKTLLDQWVKDYGEDSDFVRVRVRGEFPLTNSNALLGEALVSEAMTRHLREDQYNSAPRVLGIDIARFGDDRTVIYPRQGLASFKPVIMRSADNTEVAARVAVAIDRFKPVATFIDAGGGAGVIDILRRAGYEVIEVHFGGKPVDARYRNRRTEMWYLMAEWVKAGGALAYDKGLIQELTEPTYWFHGDKFELEPKDQIKSRLGFSPDLGDALALTFAMPIRTQRTVQQIRVPYDPMDEIRREMFG